MLKNKNFNGQTKEKEYDLKNDIIFKAFFSRKGNEEYLIDFLEALLKIEIAKIKIREEVNLEQLARERKRRKYRFTSSVKRWCNSKYRIADKKSKKYGKKNIIIWSKNSIKRS